MAREDYPVGWLWQGDVNGDGVIDMRDIGLMAANYKKPASEAPECDLDGDGWVSILDLEKCVNNFALKYEEWVKAVTERLKRAAVIASGLATIPIGIGAISVVTRSGR